MDYSDFKADGDPSKPKKEAKIDGNEGYWWVETEPARRGQMVCDAVAALNKEQGQVARHNLNLMHARMYGNFDLLGFGPRQFYQGAIASVSKIALNVISSSIDTLGAKIAKHKPKATFLTNGSAWSEQQQAKRLDKFVRGLFYETKVYEKDPLVFLDAGVFGTGGVYIYVNPTTKKLEVERAFMDELLVDEADARYGNPRQLFRTRLVAREVLEAMFAGDAAALVIIEGAKSPADANMRGFGDMLEVCEAWHLPSSKKAKDGIHSIALDGKELFHEEWKMKRFPFAFFHFKPRIMGFWGEGGAEMLTGIQLEINRLVRSISEQLRRKGRGRVFVPQASRIPPEMITNGISDVIPFSGTMPPIVDNANAVAQEEFMQLERLWNFGFQIIGVSEMSVSAKKPAGLDAAVALREYEDIESERFAQYHQRWDAFHMDMAELMLDVLADAGKNYVVKYQHKRYMEEIKWSDLEYTEGCCTIQIFPSSSLPQTPAARRQAVKELMADQFIDRATAQKLLDFPDLEAEMNLGNAAIDDVDATIDAILYADKPKLATPDKYQNLELLITRATASLLYAKHHDCELKRLDMLRQLIDQASAQVLQSMTAPTPMPAGGPDAPPMEGMPPPGGAPGPGGAPTQNMSVNMPAQPPTPAVPPLVAG